MKDELLENFKVFNGNIKDVLGKKNNLWLGVSISLKPYSKNLAKKYLSFISKYSKDKSLVFIADEIASVNYHILERYNKNTSIKKALEKGNIFVRNYEKLLDELPEKDKSKIVLARWADIWNKTYEKMYEILKEEYKSNSDFRREIEAPIRVFLKNSKRNINDSRVEDLSEYILKELPFLLDGVEYLGIKYKSLVYPTYGKTSLSRLVTLIQKGEKYPNLKMALRIKGNNILVDSSISIEKYEFNSSNR